MNMSRRCKQIPIAIDQLINTLFGGWADETISSVAWRKRHEGKGWGLLRKMIDSLFFWQETVSYTHLTLPTIAIV